jgi:hypothetical protein
MTVTQHISSPSSSSCYTAVCGISEKVTMDKKSQDKKILTRMRKCHLVSKAINIKAMSREQGYYERYFIDNRQSPFQGEITNQPNSQC